MSRRPRTWSWSLAYGATITEWCGDRSDYQAGRSVGAPATMIARCRAGYRPRRLYRLPQELHPCAFRFTSTAVSYPALNRSTATQSTTTAQP